MNGKVLISKATALLFKEMKVSKEMVSSSLIRKAIDLTKDGASGSEFASESSVERMRTMIYKTLSVYKDVSIDLNSFVGDIKIACEGDSHMEEVIFSTIGGLQQEDDELIKGISSLREILNSFINDEELSRVLSKSTRDFKFNRDSIANTAEWLDDVTQKMKDIKVGGNKNKRGVIGIADFDDISSVESVFKDMKDQKKSSKIFRTGFQGVNEMFHSGLRRGEFVVVNGLPHKNKSGFNLSLFSQIARYNNPHPVEKEGAKPMLLRISFEDDLHMNMKSLYQELRMSDGADPEDILDIDEWTKEDLADYVHGALQQTGFKVVMMRVNPTEWSFRDVFDMVDYYTAEGYEVQSLFLDYAAMLPTTGCTQGAIGHDLRNMFQRFKNFASERNILFVTPHQINPNAKELLLLGKLKDKSFVRDIVGRGLYLGCRSLDNEIDLEMNIHLYEFEGKTFFTVGWGKHRNYVTASSKKLCVYQFPSHGMPIPSDVSKDFPAHFTEAPGYDDTPVDLPRRRY